MKINHLADLTREEYRGLLGFKKSVGVTSSLKASNCTHDSISPTSGVDWRTNGGVSEVTLVLSDSSKDFCL